MSAREALAKLSDVDAAFVDDTARGILRMKEGRSPAEDSLNAALASLKCSVVRLEKTEVPLAMEALEISVEGLG